MASDSSGDEEKEQTFKKKFKKILILRNQLKQELSALKLRQEKEISLQPKQLQSDQELLQQSDAGLTEDELALKNTIERIIAAPNTITPGRSAYGEHDGEIKKMTLNEPCCSHQKDELRPPQIRPANPEATDGYGEHEEEIERMFNASQSSNSSETHPFADSGSEYIPTSDSESTPSIIENEDPNIREYGDPDEGRKRTRVADPTNWKRQKAKILRMQGKKYIGFTRTDNKIHQNKPRAARKIGPKCDLKLCSKTSKRQCQSISENERNDIFKKFWGDMDWKQRKIFIVNHVTQTAPLRRYKKDGDSKRDLTKFYHLTVGDKRVQVCKKTFLSTLGLGEFTVRGWLKKSEHGMHNKPQAAIKNTEKRDLMIQFFDTLPKLPSHYARKDTRKLYLQADIKSHRHLYGIYKQFCEDAQKTDRIASIKLFHEVFFMKNLAIYKLKKDKCDLCEGFKIGGIDETVHREHVLKKDKAREEKSNDKERALKDECTVLTMDLQAVKNSPDLKCSAFYYKTKLSCHNFTVYNLATHHARCYWYTECDTDQTASTYASCLIDYLKECCMNEKKKIIIYSDGCTAQNRNTILSNALLDYSINNNIAIEQKFLEVGHTQMECDSVHASIERLIKNREIHLPSEYISITREARTKPFPYEVKFLDYTFFTNYDDSALQRYTSIRPGKKAGDPCVVDIRMIKYSPHDHKILVKLNFDSDFMELPHRPKQRSNEDSLPRPEWPRLHKSKLKITARKWKDLQDLKFALPSDTHHFYDSLPHYN